MRKRTTAGWSVAVVILAVVAAAAGDRFAATATAAENLIRSAGNGAWSDPATWEGGKVPGRLARVQVRSGHRVVYDVAAEVPLRMIHVAGTLTFAPDRDTRLEVGLIKIQPGEDASEDGFDCDDHFPAQQRHGLRPALEVGTPARPIDAAHKALIRLAYIEGMDPQSCPAIVCCAGRMDFHGAPMSRTWVKLGATAAAGESRLTLGDPVTGWREGDRLLITATKGTRDTFGTRRRPNGDQEVFSEVRTLRSIEGKQVMLDAPLEHEHLGEGEFRGEVANLSRNVIVESADPAGHRGHTMYHVNSAGAISYAEFRHLGKEGTLGRYALHFHLVGNSMRGSYVIGASIWDSHNRWLTIHGTNYLVVRDCVGYQSVGHGFFLEDGTEVFNVLDRNLAVQAYSARPLPRQVLPFDPNDGAGFWWANNLNTFTRNVASENDRYGFRFDSQKRSNFDPVLPVLQPDGQAAEVDIRTLPFIRFEGNEAHCDGKYGFNLGEGVDRAGPDAQHPLVVRDMKIWEVHYAFRPQSPCLLVENMTLHRAAYGVYHPNYDHHVYRNLTISRVEAEPFNRGHDDRSVQYGPLAVDGLTFTDIRSGGMPLIQISDDNPDGLGVSHFRNVKTVNWTGSRQRALVNLGGGPRPTPKTEKGVPIYLHDWFAPGRHAKVVSTRSNEYRDGTKYFEHELLTGDESRVAEVRDVVFPELLDPVDDLPPVTVITHVLADEGRLLVRGTTTDNGPVRCVVVNGREAQATEANFAQWEIVLDAPAKEAAAKLVAYAEDTAGNREKMAHELDLSGR